MVRVVIHRVDSRKLLLIPLPLGLLGSNIAALSIACKIPLVVTP